MKVEEMTARQHMIYGAILRYARDMGYDNVTRWDCVNFLIGYYGAITTDHITAIQVAVREEVVKL